MCVGPPSSCISATNVDIGYVRELHYYSGCLLQTVETWANAGVYRASCAHALGSMFIGLFVCLFVCFTGNSGESTAERHLRNQTY